MSSTNFRSNWRQRMAEKDRIEKENAARAVEEEQRKGYANTEENFPSNLVRMARPVAPKIREFANRAAEAEEREVARRAVEEFRRKKARSGAYNPDNVFIHNRRSRWSYDEDDEVETVVDNRDLDEIYPPHGKRGTYGPVHSDPMFGAEMARHAEPNPDGTQPTSEDFSEGWRQVTKLHRRRRVLTNAELERRARAEILGEEDEEDDDLNGDLTDRNQRREFY